MCRFGVYRVSYWGRDIALTRGHAGNALKGAKNAFAIRSVEAARLADIMRQVCEALLNREVHLQRRGSQWLQPNTCTVEANVVSSKSVKM